MAQAFSVPGMDFLAPHKKNSKTEGALFQKIQKQRVPYFPARWRVYLREKIWPMRALEIVT